LSAEERGPLAGVRVLDLCHFLAGWYATLTLADLGADVVRLEDPDHLATRNVGPYFAGEQSLYFAALNWGKRSIAVRLERPEGRDIALDLVRNADVLVDNFRPGVTAKLGLDHRTVAEINPRLVTCSITAFGETGPYAARPGYDYTVQALAGVMSLTGEPDGPPGKAGISYVDHSGGLAAALSVCAALVERGRTGTGRHVDLGLLDVQISMLSYLAAWHLNAGYSPERTPSGAHPTLTPAQTFATRDSHVSLFVGNDRLWARLVRAVGDERLADDRFATNPGRLEHGTELLELLGAILCTRGSADWTALFAEHDVACAPVNSVGEALADDQVQSRGLVGDSTHPVYGGYRHVRGPVPAVSPRERPAAPLVGEHTRELLAALGYDAARVDELVACGAVSTT
jgi:crotonobetainyl-CoA:carnitine CoA-transferase CaiB-like acyl-CoA transferase